MKKNYILLLLLCLCFAGCKEKLVVESDHLPIADPYVMLYRRYGGRRGLCLLLFRRLEKLDA